LANVGEAASLAAPEGHLRRFCEAAPAITPLLRELHDDPDLAPHVTVSPFFYASVIDAICSAPAVRRTSAVVVDELVEQLSERELEVLSLLEHETSYSNIGVQLYVSRNTVKSHVQHIYTKLGVSSRGAAVAEAQRLGLL
jgi:DNA-binding CsgD family transcriptional regulator